LKRVEHHIVIRIALGLLTIVTGAPPAIAGERLVYSNTTGQESFAAVPGFVIADDILMTGAEGCELSRYSFVVSGNADGSGSGAFGVEHALYDACPRMGGQVIPGTLGFTELPDEGIHTVSFAVPIDIIIPLPARFWIGLKFDRSGAGWVGGSPALVGYTNFSYGDPVHGCSATLGGAFPFSSWGGLSAEIYARGNCQSTFRPYHAAGSAIAGIAMEAGTRIAEDLQLSVGDCQLRAYEVSVRGTGPIDIDLRLTDETNFGLPGDVVANSAFTYGASTNRSQIARRTFDPPVPVSDQLWVTIQTDANFIRTNVVRKPIPAGITDRQYAVLNEAGWERTDLPGFSAGGALEISLICDGDAPTGACCDMFVTDESGEAVCRDVAEMNCPYPPRGSTLLPGWREGDLCSSMPFDLPCGVAACCGADGVCADLTENQCAVNGVSWSQGTYCDDPAIQCEFVCVASDETCTLPHQSVGCADPFCCRAVCAIPLQDFCCDIEWDQICAIATASVCAIPPSNDECAPTVDLEGARLLSVPDSLESDGVHATENVSDPGFCCHEEAPGARGLGTVWYKFLATETSVRIRTCQSASPATDSLVRLFAVGNPASDETACSTLTPIGCNDNTEIGCGFVSENSQLCVSDLTVGDLYYLLVAAKTEETRGRYRVEITAPCGEAPPPSCPCPVGAVRWVNPEPEIVDARRPHPPDDGNAPEGDIVFSAETPDEADRAECWTVCESSGGTPVNAIVDLIPGPGGTTTLFLERPITPGSVTLIAYTDGFGSVTRGEFVSHPGNVNADAVADSIDVLWIMATLDGLVELPFDLASGDIDRSDRITPLDVLEEINLLNGAGAFDAWNQSALPTAPGSCP